MQCATPHMRHWTAWPPILRPSSTPMAWTPAIFQWLVRTLLGMRQLSPWIACSHVVPHLRAGLRRPREPQSLLRMARPLRPFSVPMGPPRTSWTSPNLTRTLASRCVTRPPRRTTSSTSATRLRATTSRPTWCFPTTIPILHAWRPFATMPGGHWTPSSLRCSSSSAISRITRTSQILWPRSSCTIRSPTSGTSSCRANAARWPRPRRGRQRLHLLVDVLLPAGFVL
mmetsp:Transcript_122630/g.346749  ORF Transcript_122630/g.346749 Transcript_122630/m.346749 type:complete len:227 (-) Transcript_122630:66-746(-)